MKKIITIAVLSGILVSGGLIMQACKKKTKEENSPSNSNSNSNNNNSNNNSTPTSGTVVVYAKSSYCANYTGEITINADGTDKGKLSNCYADRKCNDDGTITFTLANGKHTLKAASSSYSSSLEVTINGDSCYKWVLE
jgi:hypothetical protein